MPTRILVVDDEPDLELLIRQKFRPQIRDRQFEFLFARSGLQALETLQEVKEIDIILTDINMPEMDGLTPLSKLSEHGPILKAVIVFTYGDMDNIRTAMNRGAFDFLTKPIDFQDLQATINETLQEVILLKQGLIEHEQLVSIQRELDIASRIQQSILPRVFTPPPGVTGYEIYAEMIPAKQVGGDFYDFFFVDGERLGFVIGDVSGKGVPAAIYMALSRALLRATALQGLSPGECLDRVNAVLCLENESGMFVTVCYGILNLGTGGIEYSTGGHHPPYLLRSTGAVEVMEATGGMVVGMMEQVEFHTKNVLLRPEDSVVLYTDGVTEAVNSEDEFFSDAPLMGFLEHSYHRSPRQIIDGIVAEVKQFSTGIAQSDDITVLALKFHGV